MNSGSPRTSSRTQGQGSASRSVSGPRRRATRGPRGGQLTLSWQRWHDFLSWVKRTGAD